MQASEYKNIFDNEETHGWYRGMKAISLSLLDRYLPKKTDLKILDAGCGTGGMMVALKKYGNVTGFDFSPLAVKYCRQRKLNVKLGSVEKPEYPSHSTDLITCFDVLYISRIKYKIALAEFARVLRKGGILLIRLPAFGFLYGAHDKVVFTGHRFTTGEVAGAMKKAGLKIRFASYANFFLFLPILIARLFSRCGEPKSDVSKLPGAVNTLIEQLLRIESRIMEVTPLPFGVSLFVIAQK